MALQTTTAQGLQTGDRFRESLDDGREVWVDGKRIANVAEHAAFKPAVDLFADLFDQRLADPEALAASSFRSPVTGNPVSRSYALPRTAEDLRAKFRASEWWMRQSLGQLGRSPDFMANVVVGLWDYHQELEGNRAGFGENAKNYHAFAMEQDLVLTHALGDPQIDRSASPLDDPDLALRVVEENDDGIVIRGAKQLATLAPFSNEVLVYLNGVTAQRGAEQFVLWFALPLNAPGLTILCREPLARPDRANILAASYDEQDAMLFFDDVLVPWDRVFLLGDGLLAAKGLTRINAWSIQSTHIRFHERLRLFVSVAAQVAHAIGVDSFRGIQEDLGEIISYAETLRLGIAGAEALATTTPTGLLAPTASQGLGFWSAEISGRVAEIVRRIGASGFIMQPSEGDLASPELRPALDRYMRGHDIGVAEKSRLFRLATELVNDGFGLRQEMYEYLHRGDPGAGRTRLLRAYDRSDVDAVVRDLISRPSSH
ncbi:4-hydroxyphenylacetate 3-hydroxylase N-terminal domain-containing protein [Microbacterium betulae]|uniref:4-hydroxyphenylacetate 3-hydroxylase N-terminal domain-containing protein n=1 Tax=Microbacterium betulae TaxID=2981139 RepID=A0AA97FJW4_9MICO|nr:4-hydroxyphenylacetate 3-hydroxylase N-terminal domain-containing protein [Microbacterium sp. AB]WOF22867.1 4-hydroxyphenylacetate 3-hydroxylase N-terminal domain-containing protein [Microbacterium sp. AB]